MENPKANVLNRLKLNELIKEAQKDIDDEHLPLTYALEIAKYAPEIQKHIYAEVYRKESKFQRDDWIEMPVKGEMVPWKSFIDWINTYIHRTLSKAPFDPKAINLRPDGLACIKCPERTGAVVSLFEPNRIGKKDACLNPACYQQKVETHVQVQRQALAELRKVDLSDVPIVRSWCYSDGKDYLGTESAIVIHAKKGGSDKECDKAVSGIDIEPENYGQIVQVCLKTSRCKIHWPDRINSSNDESNQSQNAEGQASERLEAHRARREEIWNAKIAEAVRVRVFKQAAEKFEKKFRFSDVGSDLLPQLIGRFWRMTSSGDSNNLSSVVKPLLNEWSGQAGNNNGIYFADGRSAVEQFKTLERWLQFRILFLLIHNHKGTIGHGNNYRSQKEVRELAAEFEVDYALIDAEARLELGAKKYDEVHKAYLDAVQKKDKETKVPNLFSQKWTPVN